MWKLQIPMKDMPVKPKKIMVYGVTGSGKTTLAGKLGTKLSLPWHAMDDLTFEANWVSVPVEEQRRKVAEICAGSEWIIDTAYGTWLDIVLKEVDLVVGLDYPRWFSLGRLTRRTFWRLFDQKTVCNGNRETLKTLFSRGSIILWHFKSFDRKRERMRKWDTSSDGPEIILFRRARDVDTWLATLTP